MTKKAAWEEFIIFQHRSYGAEMDPVTRVRTAKWHKVPICGLCGNGGEVQLHRDFSGKEDKRHCICPNGRALKKADKQRAKSNEITLEPEPVTVLSEEYEPAHYRNDWED